MSLPLHRHHDTYAIVLIAPSVEDSMEISHKIWQDNWQRERIIDAGGPDPGRNDETDWSEVRKDRVLVLYASADRCCGGCLLRPDHFLIDNAAVLNKVPLHPKPHMLLQLKVQGWPPT